MQVTQRHIDTFKHHFYNNTADETSDPIAIALQALFAGFSPVVVSIGNNMAVNPQDVSFMKWDRTSYMYSSESSLVITMTGGREYTIKHEPWYSTDAVAIEKAILGAIAGDSRSDKTFQMRAMAWATDCFGMKKATSREQRRNRFLEEALELVQACGSTKAEALQLVDYVFARPIGDQAQEAGGVTLTLALMLYVYFIDMDEAGETELARVTDKMEQIRAKEAARPEGSVLPGGAVHG